jgi:quinoprotein glucose dehydrogenase
MFGKIYFFFNFLLKIFHSQKFIILKNCNKNLNEIPWGSTFINNNELIITEKSGKIKNYYINSKKFLKLIII